MWQDGKIGPDLWNKIYDAVVAFYTRWAGILTVKQKRTDLLAQSVIELLKDSKKCQLLGEAGKQHVEEMEKMDIGLEWKSFFDSLYSGKEKESCKSE